MTIAVEDIRKSYGNTVVLGGINAEIEEGKITTLLGPSGSGKTTLLRVIAGLETADSGKILFDGNDMTKVSVQKRGIGFMFQNYALFQNMTVSENIAFGLTVKKGADRPSKEQISKKVKELLAMIKLESLGGRRVDQLSGGQKQRVALARALAVEPRILLLDEPFGALDAKVREELRTYLLHLQRKLGITTIMVTHDQEEALEISDRIIILNHGRIEQAGSPDEVYDTPENPFVFSFLGHVNIFRGRVDDGFAVLDEKSPDQIFIRPHEIRLSLRRHQGDVPALIRSSRNLGFHTVVSLELENQESSSYVTADLDRTVWLQLRAGAVNDTVYLNFAHFKFYSEQTKKFSDYELKTKWSYSI